ncbi:acyl-CoA thioesterase II [Maricaulis sp. W15]|uniref:acyl-CoA thioesterase n=1 Tax=Maricaulis sp. W15 TaxID=1772333 RepID=UPI0009491D6F|nr:acyl-CoA thioesterase II [Maricaulis sp. W15]
MDGADTSQDEKKKRRDYSPAELAAGLVHLLDVEEIDVDLYRGRRNPGGQGRVFGGQVIAQALKSAVASVDPERHIHSLHAYFMRPGDEDFPIIYRVERDYDGGSFSNRRVIAMQRGKPILNMTASFQKPEAGLTHQFDLGDVAMPDDLPTEVELLRKMKDQIPEPFYRFMTRPRPIEMRPVDPWSPIDPRPREPKRQIWIRATDLATDDQVMHRAILAFASDMALLSTCMQPHGVSWMTRKMQSASLDHAVWFHDDVDMSDWLLYDTDSPWSGGARGFNRGQLFTRDGRLVASTAQEGLIRLRDE